jgi:UDP-N-acetylglucosamine:LPS N-acetylglucosamine transferase
LFDQPAVLQAMAANARRLAKPDAARSIVGLIEQAAQA